LVSVLLYHLVSQRRPRGLGPITVTPEQSEAHADAILGSGRTAPTATEVAACLRRKRALPRDVFSTTFDDRYHNTYFAVKSLAARGLPATILVTTGAIDGRSRLSAAQVIELAAMPKVELGAHGVSRQLERERSARANANLRTHGSRDAFVRLSARELHRMAREAVIRAGYDSAVAVKNAVKAIPGVAPDPERGAGTMS
jgi:peptidoglycan/xylan/chitin deacetylase (PgdA/CDA1 family)